MDDFEEKLNKIVWRRPAPKKKRKKILSKKIWFIGGIFLIVSVAGGVFFLSSVFQVKKIDVFGTTETTAALIESFVRSYLNGGSSSVGGNNILLFDAGKLEEKIKAEFPVVEKMKIKKDFLQRAISVEVVERKSIGIWCVGATPCFYIERQGSIFKEAPPAEGSLIFLIKRVGLSEIPPIGAKVIDENFLDFMLKIKEEMSSLANIKAKEFLLKTGSSDVEVLTVDGFKIFFDSKKNPHEQIANLKIMLEEKIKEKSTDLEYIDLREGNRIYYKLKEEE